MKAEKMKGGIFEWPFLTAALIFALVFVFVLTIGFYIRSATIGPPIQITTYTEYRWISYFPSASLFYLTYPAENWLALNEIAKTYSEETRKWRRDEFVSEFSGKGFDLSKFNDLMRALEEKMKKEKHSFVIKDKKGLIISFGLPEDYLNLTKWVSFPEAYPYNCQYKDTPVFSREIDNMRIKFVLCCQDIFDCGNYLTGSGRDECPKDPCGVGPCKFALCQWMGKGKIARGNFVCSSGKWEPISTILKTNDEESYYNFSERPDNCNPEPKNCIYHDSCLSCKGTCYMSGQTVVGDNSWLCFDRKWDKCLPGDEGTVHGNLKCISGKWKPISTYPRTNEYYDSSERPNDCNPEPKDCPYKDSCLSCAGNCFMSGQTFDKEWLCWKGKWDRCLPGETGKYEIDECLGKKRGTRVCIYNEPPKLNFFAKFEDEFEWKTAITRPFPGEDKVVNFRLEVEKDFTVSNISKIILDFGDKSSDAFVPRESPLGLRQEWNSANAIFWFSHTYKKPGDYTVVCTVRDADEEKLVVSLTES